MPSPLSIVFCGTPDLACPTLKAIAEDDRYTVELVVTQPDRPVGRKQVLTPPPVKLLAEKLGLPVFQPENINETWQDNVPVSFDVLLVIAYGCILKNPILEAPNIAPLNAHVSLLPRWRGASPIQNAILAGDTESGVSLQRIVKAVDAGPIYRSVSTPIAPRETAETLHDRLAQLAATLCVDTIANLPEPIAQDETQVTRCQKLSREDGYIDPNTMTAEEIDRRVRALTPWPGVTWKDKNLKLIESSLEPDTHTAAISCKNNTTLHVKKVQPAGKTVMNGADWERGRQSN